MAKAYNKDLEARVEAEYLKRSLKTAETAASFILLYFFIAFGRRIFGATPELVWIIGTLFTLLSMRMFVVNRYVLISQMGNLLIMLIVLFGIAALGFWILFGIPSVYEKVMEPGGPLSLSLFLGNIFLAATVSAIVWLKLGKSFEIWADQKLRQSIEKSLKAHKN